MALIVCSLAYGYFAWGLPVRSLPNTPGPSFFPLLVTVVLLALSATLLVQGLLAPNDGEMPTEETPKRFCIRKTLLALSVLLLYIAVLPTLGFILSTLPLFAALMVLYGERRPLVVLVGTVVMTIVLYGLFRHGFNIFLPRGLLAGIVA